MPPITSSIECQGGSSVVSIAFRGRSALSLPRNQIASMEQGHEQELEDLDLFQTHVADGLFSLLLTLSPSSPDHDKRPAGEQSSQILTISFLQKLLDALLSWEEDFKALLLLLVAGNPAIVSRPPIERLLSDLLDRTVKSLDICNAITLSLQSLCQWNRNADIAASALVPHRQQCPPPPLGEGQLNRARKALDKLISSSQHDSHHHHESGGGRRTERNSSCSYVSNGGRCNSGSREGHSRSISGHISRTWSAGKQMHAMAANLGSPRGADAGGGVAVGLAIAVYTMNSVLVFSMWALVAAFPCQDRGAPIANPVAPPRHRAWAAAMIGLQERISEEWRRSAKRGGSFPAAPAGLLAEFQGVERCGKELMEAVGEAAAAGSVSGGEVGGGMTGEEEKAEEVVGKAAELAEASRRLGESLGPFERQVREVFHRIVSSRAEVIRCLDHGNRSAPPSLIM